ncbi:facilitated trehalose transporter Tret1-like isoform X2 [Arctopsyche grandis]|uniref:facilitated trehalose transporter Tret1-like isoform X2 n=1 Tax=Arctopsyche grandis TaxID=121162 RepID=UPI00406D6474
MGDTAQHMLSVGEKPSGESRKLTQYLAAAAASLGAVTAGTILAWTSPVLSQLKPPNNTAPLNISEVLTAVRENFTATETSNIYITEEQGSWIGSFLAIGALIFAIPIGMLAEAVGRKISILALVIPFLISWVLIIFANGVEMIYAARFFSGIATGGICVTAPMYIGEIAETSIRGALGSFFQLFLTIGILFANLIGGALTWRIFSVVCSIIPVIFAVAFFFVPETPQYLLKKNKLREAEKSLRWLRGPNFDISSEIEAMQKEVDNATQNKASLKDLVVSRANRNALICSLGLMFFQQFSGINAVIFYTVDIFKSAGSDLDPFIAAIIVTVVQVIFTIVSFLLIEKAGRRILLLQSCIAMGLSLLVIGIFFNFKDGGKDVSSIGWIPLTSMVVFIITFSLGFGPIPWMMMGELFSAECKGVASGIAVMLNWILVFVVTKFFPTMVLTLGKDITFWIFAGFMLAAVFFVYFVIPETKGKSSAQIQAQLAGK